MEYRDVQITWMKNKLRSLSTSLEDDGNCSIYKIPEFLREGREKHFRPSVISIGPIFYKHSTLETMQEMKWNFLKCFPEHPSKSANHNLEFYFDTLGKWEKKARGCYQAKISLTSNEFTEMMLLDAAFLIYYFMLIHSPTLQSPFQGETKHMALLLHLDKDLFLLENQLPFFILKDLYDLAFGTDNQHVSFDDLTCFYLSKSYLLGCEATNNSNVCKRIKERSIILHLLDFWRICCLPLDNHRGEFTTLEKFSDLNLSTLQYSLSAKELRAAGVKFVAGDSKRPLDIKFFKDIGVLEIPKLILDVDAESPIRNIIFFEQCHYLYNSYLLDYIYFISALIDSVEDVQILVQNGILLITGEENEVVECIKNVNRDAAFSFGNFYYTDVMKKVKEYARTDWNQWKAILRRDYFQHPWAIISVIYAIILFILTLLQTIAGFITK